MIARLGGAADITRAVVRTVGARVGSGVGQGDRSGHALPEAVDAAGALGVVESLGALGVLLGPGGRHRSGSGAEVLAFLRDSARDLNQTIVMVTHDPVAASYADRVVFLRDGRLVDEVSDPTAELVSERLLKLEA